MKSLQSKYNLITEGKGSKDVFIKQAKAEFPQYISNVMTYDQIVNRLKERAIINEKQEIVKQPVDWFKTFKGHLNEEKVPKEIEDLETKTFDYKDRKNPDNIAPGEFYKGFYVEMEDPKNDSKTVEQLKAIVNKNLAKDPLYYVKSSQFGLKGIGYTDETPSLRTSKSDQMEKVKINENGIRLNTTNLTEAVKLKIQKYLQEIDKKSEATALRFKLDEITVKIEELHKKLTMTESEDLQDIVDRKAVKTIKKNIALLEKKKKIWEKAYTKHDKSYKPEEQLIKETDSDERLNQLRDLILRYVDDSDVAEDEIDRYLSSGEDRFSDMVSANLQRDPDYQTWKNEKPLDTGNIQEVKSTKLDRKSVV